MPSSGRLVSWLSEVFVMVARESIDASSQSFCRERSMGNGLKGICKI